MSSRHLKIRDFCEVFDGPHATPQKTDEGPFYLSISSLENGTLDLSKSAHVSEQEYTKWTKRVTPRKGDLLFSYETRLGEAALMPDGVKACLGRRMGILRPDPQKVLPAYLLYSYLAPEFQGVIVSNTITGATVHRLSLTDLPDFQMWIPPIEVQQLTVAVLSALDAKIELNQQINAELEGMAKLLYDYWFIQYDFPMSAAQAAALGKPHLTGHPYRASGGKMIYNETLKREIPKGWEVSTLSDFAKITMGQSPPGDSYNQEGTGSVFFQGSTDFGWRYPDVREYTTAPSRLAKAGDILLSVRAPVGTLNIADRDCCIGRGLAALHAKTGHNSFLFEVMLYFKAIFDRRNASGTTFGSITKDDLHELIFSRPPFNSPLLDEFESKTKPMHQAILTNHQQTQELTTLRDWLLPMLMNGQVSVG